MSPSNDLRVEPWLGQLLAHSPVVLYARPALGERARFTWISDNIMPLFGYTSAECLAPSWWHDRLHPEDRGSVLAQWAALPHDGRLVTEYRFRRRDGQYRWLRDAVQRAPETDRQPAICVGAWSDITEREPVDQALRQAEAQYRGMVEESLQGIVVQQDGRIQYANPACLRLFGYDAVAEVIGQPWERFVAAEDLPDLRARGKACARGEPVHLHPGWQGVRKDGTRLWLESAANACSWHGRPAILSFLMDITQRKRLEEQFLQAQKMEAIGQLAGGVAHDFNNLLTVINGYSELLLRSMAPEDANRTLVDELRQAGERAASLTRQLLLLSRKQVVVPRVLDLNTVVRDLQKLLQRMIGEDIELATALNATRPVLAHSGQLDQILLNLAVNARDALPQGGKVIIETQDIDLDAGYTRLHPAVAPGPYVLLAMSDSGCGMTPEVQAHIFEPFFTTKDASKGTGLGLATVYGIVRQFGGHIAVYSEPGHGTTFKIYLPWARDEAQQRSNPAELPAVAPGHETVLLVEDEYAVRSLVRHVLADGGYSVLEAHDGREALRICARQADPIDLLITDVVMPEMSGQQLAATAIAAHPNLRVLFLSGYTEEAVLRHGVLPEKVHFLQKPFTASALTRKVREVLDEPGKG